LSSNSCVYGPGQSTVAEIHSEYSSDIFLKCVPSTHHYAGKDVPKTQVHSGILCYWIALVCEFCFLSSRVTAVFKPMWIFMYSLRSMYCCVVKLKAAPFILKIEVKLGNWCKCITYMHVLFPLGLSLDVCYERSKTEFRVPNKDPCHGKLFVRCSKNTLRYWKLFFLHMLTTAALHYKNIGRRREKGVLFNAGLCMRISPMFLHCFLTHSLLQNMCFSHAIYSQEKNKTWSKPEWYCFW